MILLLTTHFSPGRIETEVATSRVRSSVKCSESKVEGIRAV